MESGCECIGSMKYVFIDKRYCLICVSWILGESIVNRAFRTSPDHNSVSDLDGSGSLAHPPRLRALPAVPRHPVRALAVRPAVEVRAEGVPAGGASAAPLEALLSARQGLTLVHFSAQRKRVL